MSHNKDTVPKPRTNGTHTRFLNFGTSVLYGSQGDSHVFASRFLTLEAEITFKHIFDLWNESELNADLCLRFITLALFIEA